MDWSRPMHPPCGRVRTFFGVQGTAQQNPPYGFSSCLLPRGVATPPEHGAEFLEEVLESKEDAEREERDDRHADRLLPGLLSRELAEVYPETKMIPKPKPLDAPAATENSVRRRA